MSGTGRLAFPVEKRATGVAPAAQAPFTDVVTPPTGAARVRLVLILGALIALGPLTIDMYLPALPEITTDLLTTEATVQLTLTGTLLGLAAVSYTHLTLPTIYSV